MLAAVKRSWEMAEVDRRQHTMKARKNRGLWLETHRLITSRQRDVRALPVCLKLCDRLVARLFRFLSLCSRCSVMWHSTSPVSFRLCGEQFAFCQIVRVFLRYVCIASLSLWCLCRFVPPERNVVTFNLPILAGYVIFFSRVLLVLPQYQPFWVPPPLPAESRKGVWWMATSLGNGMLLVCCGNFWADLKWVQSEKREEF